MIKLNTSFIVFSIYRFINFVRWLLVLYENEMIIFYYWGHQQWNIKVLKFRPTSIFCSNMLSFFYGCFLKDSKNWGTSILTFPVLITSAFQSVFSIEHSRDECGNIHCNSNNNDWKSSAGSRRTIGGCKYIFASLNREFFSKICKFSMDLIQRDSLVFWRRQSIEAGFTSLSSCGEQISNQSG